MATRQTSSNFVDTFNSLQWPQLMRMWTDSLEAGSQEMERFQAALWEQSLGGLTMFRQQVDANIEFMRSWSQTWQKHVNQQCHQLSDLANGQRE